MTPVPAVIQSDPVRLRQIMVNQVGNAIKFTSAGRVRIEVRYDEAMQTMMFAVVDTGVGMTPQQSAKLFRAFEQADTTTSREFGGTGLGLHISQRLAEMLDGRITCNSSYGKGSTFTLSINVGALEQPQMLPAGRVTAVKNKPDATSEANEPTSVYGTSAPPFDRARDPPGRGWQGQPAADPAPPHQGRGAREDRRERKARGRGALQPKRHHRATAAAPAVRPAHHRHADARDGRVHSGASSA